MITHEWNNAACIIPFIILKLVFMRREILQGKLEKRKKKY